MTTALLAAALDLAEKHALRGYDAVQLAAALEANEERAQASLPPLVLVTADNDLLVASVAEGLLQRIRICTNRHRKFKFERRLWFFLLWQ